MSKLEYFYDFSSPYAYLANEEVERVAQAHGAEVAWRPFLLGGLFRQLGSSMVPINDASVSKRSFLNQDIRRWAEIRDLPLRWPSKFPVNSIRALRVALQLEGEERVRVSRAIFAAYWSADIDISDAEALGAALDQAGFDAEALLAGCADPDVKARLFANTNEMFERGGVGAPAFFVGDLHFWGQDRFEMVERALQGWRPDGE